MAGSYCRYCGFRCFVYREVRVGGEVLWWGHMATCADGQWLRLRVAAWRVVCSDCGWVDHFDARASAQEEADRHNDDAATSWPHAAVVRATRGRP